MGYVRKGEPVKLAEWVWARVGLWVDDWCGKALSKRSPSPLASGRLFASRSCEEPLLRTLSFPCPPPPEVDLTEPMAQPPRIKRSIDIKTLPLQPEEAFVFSRVDGQAQPKEIALTTGMSTDQVERALDRLSELGALEGWHAKKPPPPAPSHVTPARPVPATPAQPPFAQAAQTPSMDDGFTAVPDIDLNATEQQRVYRLWKRLGQANHYELLGVTRDATREQVKAAYFEQVSAFHPDKHYGKALGTYKEKLESVFQRLTQAHDTLSRTRRREEYDATLPPPLPAEAAPKLETAKAERPTSARPSEKPRKTSRPAPPRRVPPPPARASGEQPAPEPVGQTSVTPSSRLAGSASGPAPSSRNSPQAAATNASSAAVKTEVSVPPVSPEERRQIAIRSLERGLRSMPAGERPSKHPSVPGRRSPSTAPPSSRSVMLERGRGAEREGDLLTAATCYEKAAGTSKDSQLFARAAECLERYAHDNPNVGAAHWKRAAESARQAVALAPANTELRLLLSRIFAGAGMRASATREAEKAQELSPSEKSVQSWLERLRRGDV